MADVQPDRCMLVHRDIPTALNLAGLSLSEIKVAHAVIRASWGWQEKTTTHRLSHTMLEQHTGIKDRKQRKRALDGLVNKGILVLVSDYDEAARRPAEWAIVKDYESWDVPPFTIPWRQAPRGSRTPEGSNPGGQGGLEPRRAGGFRTPDMKTTSKTTSKTNPPKPPAGGQVALIQSEVPTRPEPVLAVWKGYVVGRDSQRKAPGKDASRRIKAALREYSVEELILVSEWVLQAPDDYCRRQREGDYTTYTTIYKATGMQDRVDKAKKWRDAGRPSANASQEAQWTSWFTDPEGECAAARATYSSLKAMGQAPSDVAAWLASKPGAPPVQWLRQKIGAGR